LKLNRCLGCLYLCAFAFLWCSVFSSEVQAKNVSRHQQLNSHFHQVLASSKSKLESRLNALLSVATTDEEKAWLVYRWVTHHFEHDAGLASSIGDPAQHSLEKLHKLGGGSCAVYANVTHRLMQMAGLEVKTIYGLVKGGPATANRDGKPVNHVWNAVNLNGVWWVVDTTWGAGFVDRDGFKSQHSDLFFLIPPERTVLSHFDPSDELGHQRAFGVNQSLFTKLPDDSLYVAAVGLEPRLIVDAARRDSRLKLVSTFDLPANALRVIQAPVNGILERKMQSFLIESDTFDELMIVQGKSWIPLKKRGQAYSLTLVPDKGELLVMGRRPKQHEFEALLAYRVK